VIRRKGHDRLARHEGICGQARQSKVAGSGAHARFLPVYRAHDGDRFQLLKKAAQQIKNTEEVSTDQTIAHWQSGLHTVTSSESRGRTCMLRSIPERTR